MFKTKIKNIYFLKLLRNLFSLIGIFFFLCIILALTEQPFWGYHWLGTSKSELTTKPKEIILLGGSGMPSESNLIRSWYVEKAAKSFPDANVLIAMPGDLTDSISTPRLMESELILRGVNPKKIHFEVQGTNTRSQVIFCKKIINMKSPVLLVTSPENMRRSVLCFRKAGFEKVNALPAFENAAEADFSFNDDELGGNTILIPDVGENMNMRYQLWNHLKYEIIFARELVALSYYKIRGWI